jgi:hypothetical protein
MIPGIVSAELGIGRKPFAAEKASKMQRAVDTLDVPGQVAFARVILVAQGDDANNPLALSLGLVDAQVNSEPGPVAKGF